MPPVSARPPMGKAEEGRAADATTLILWRRARRNRKMRDGRVRPIRAREDVRHVLTSSRRRAVGACSVGRSGRVNAED